MLYFQPERMIVVDELVPAGVRSFLDVGCACGHVTSYLSRTRMIRGVGVELSQSLVEQAARYYPNGANAFVAGSGTALPFADQSFDLVVMLEVMEHVPDEGDLIREVWRVLKPGGHLVMSVPNRSWISLIDLNRAKYYLPGLHRLLYRLKHRGSAMGFSRERTNHRHYSLTDVSIRLSRRFEVQRHLYSGGLAYVAAVVISALLPASPRCDRWRQSWLTRTFRRDWAAQSFNLAVVARRLD